jgi:hypothetical protein
MFVFIQQEYAFEIIMRVCVSPCKSLTSYATGHVDATQLSLAF